MDEFGNKDITILGIETSCDETAAAVVRNGREVLSDVVSSQIDVHEIYGGVVPEIASRLHQEVMNGVIRRALSEASLSFDDIDVIAVTKGPGLVGALLVGVSTAKALSYALKKPLVGVNHIEGHIAACYLSHSELAPPYVCLVVSGGHTELIVVHDYSTYELIGSTHDDAAGETFDKVARAVGLTYPGGPKLDLIAEGGNPRAIAFPRGKVEGRPYDFTFSGLKSAVLNYINSAHMKNEEVHVPDLCASFEAAVTDALVSRTVAAALERGIATVAAAGGVSANRALRAALTGECNSHSISVFFPDLKYCTDNAAMIAARAYFDYISGVRDDSSLNAYPSLTLPVTPVG